MQTGSSITAMFEIILAPLRMLVSASARAAIWMKPNGSCSTTPSTFPSG